jgi:hypothetical protein
LKTANPFVERRIANRTTLVKNKIINTAVVQDKVVIMMLPKET